MPLIVCRLGCKYVYYFLIEQIFFKISFQLHFKIFQNSGIFIA